MTLQKTASLITTMNTITTRAMTNVLWQYWSPGMASKMSSQPETGAKLMSSHSNSVTLLHSLPTSARSWITCLPAILLWSHWQTSPLCQSPVQTIALSLQGKHHLFHNKELPQVRSVPPPAVTHQHAGSPTQSHRGSEGSSRFCPGTGPQQQLEPLHQTLLPLRFLDPVASEPGCPCPRPTFSPESETTPTGYNCHGNVWCHPAQHLGGHPLQQQHTRSGYPSCHRASAMQFTDNYQWHLHGKRYSHHGQSDPQCASESTAENHTRWGYRPFWASTSRFLAQICLSRF